MIFILLFRLSLSALHYNENSDRLQNVTVDGRPRYSMKYPKAKKGGYALQPVKGPPTYGTFIQFNIATLINKVGRMLYAKQDRWQVLRSLTSTTLLIILYSEAQLVPSKASKVELFALINNTFQMFSQKVQF